MNKILRLLAAASLFFTGTILNAQDIKFGHINSQELLSSMPESDSAQTRIERLAKDYETQMEEMQVELNKKYDEYLQNRDKYTELIRQTKEADINEMNNRIQQFQQVASQDLETQRGTLLRPIIEKANAAIRAVSEENDFIYVFDISQGNPVYFSDKSVDILPFVKSKLGL